MPCEGQAAQADGQKGDAGLSRIGWCRLGYELVKMIEDSRYLLSVLTDVVVYRFETLEPSPQ